MQAATVQGFEVDAESGLWIPRTGVVNNTRLNEWVSIVMPLLLQADAKYRIAGMYLEFANAAAPITVPSYGAGPTHGRPYYTGLSGHATKDYLRVPLESSQILAPDDANYPDGNVMIFRASTAGTVGVNGKTFSNAAGSTLIGGALIAMVDPLDATKDKLVSRFYFATSDQALKPVTNQLSVQWKIPLP